MAPMTPNTSTTPYCSAEQFFDFYSRDIAADMLKVVPQAPRPSYLAMLDPNNPAGAKFLKHLKRGAGDIEAACGVAKRYQPADLNALTGVSQTFLQALNAARTMWSLYQTLKPGSARLEECPGATVSEEYLAELRDAKLIFGFMETMDAGLPSVVPPSPGRLVTPDVVSRAVRLFPNYGLNRLMGGGN